MVLQTLPFFEAQPLLECLRDQDFPGGGYGLPQRRQPVDLGFDHTAFGRAVEFRIDLHPTFCGDGPDWGDRPDLLDRLP